MCTHVFEQLVNWQSTSHWIAFKQKINKEFFIYITQKIADFDEICQEIERETERVTGNNKVCGNLHLTSRQLSLCLFSFQVLQSFV